MMSSLAHGGSTSEVEVTHISADGVWLLAHDKELFMLYEQFQWFKDIPVKSIFNVEKVSPGHYYRADHDVDLTEEIIEYPGMIPPGAGLNMGSGPL